MCGIKGTCLFFRPFYVSTTTTIPRDVVVVLETSSAMRGDKLFEAKHAVITVMETLGVEDRVGVFCVKHSFYNNQRLNNILMFHYYERWKFQYIKEQFLKLI